MNNQELKQLLTHNEQYFKKCLKIVNKEGDLIPFKLNFAQKMASDVIEEMERKGKPVRLIILKARQLGLSTFTEGYIFRKTTTQKFKKSIIIAHEEPASANLYNMYKRFYENLPDILKPMKKYSNSSELVFENPTTDDAEKSKNPGLMSKVAVKTAKNTRSGRSDTVQYLHACLSGDSLIVLSNGSTKSMEDIKMGDMVVTSSGSLAPVTFKSCNGEKQTYTLSVWQTGQPIHCTENHKIMTLDGYKELKDITTKDYIMQSKMPIDGKVSSYIHDLQNKERPQNGGTKHIEHYEVPLTYDFGYLLGYYLAEGHVKDNLGYVTFCYHKDETYVLKALQGTNGLETSVSHKTVDNKGRTTINGKFLATMINDICGRVEGKHIPEWFFNTNELFLKGVMNGYFDGDGSKTGVRRISATSIHEKIARQIKRIILSLGYGSCNIRYESRKRYDVRTKDIYQQEICGDTWRRYLGETVEKQHRATKHIIKDGVVYCKVKSITPRKIETVYDIEVGHKDHNYETTVGIVSNSEVAFWEDPKTLMTGLMQTIPNKPNTAIILESTANGVGDYFYDMWHRAERGENGFYPLFIPWFVDPEYCEPFENEQQKKQFIDGVHNTYKDHRGREITTYEFELIQYAKEKYDIDLSYEQLNWRIFTIQNNCNGDEEQFKQEYPAYPEEAFISTGRPVFNTKALQEYLRQVTDGIRGNFHYDAIGRVFFEPNEKGYCYMFTEPQEDKYYCIGADVAEGLIDGDFSTACIGNQDDLNVDCVFHGHIDPDLYGAELVKIAKYYNNGYIGVESNNHGLTTLKAIQRLDYHSLYYSKMYDKIADKVTQKLGWGTNSRTKPLMIDRLVEFIREKYIGIKHKEMISELLTYIKDEKGSTNAQQGCNDDLVICLAIWLQLILEGRGDNYEPEQPNDWSKPKKSHGMRQSVYDDYPVEQESELSISEEYSD